MPGEVFPADSRSEGALVFGYVANVSPPSAEEIVFLVGPAERDAGAAVVHVTPIGEQATAVARRLVVGEAVEVFGRFASLPSTRRTPAEGRRAGVLQTLRASAVYTTAADPEEIPVLATPVMRHAPERPVYADAPRPIVDEEAPLELVGSGLWPSPEAPLLAPLARPGEEVKAALTLQRTLRALENPSGRAG